MFCIACSVIFSLALIISIVVVVVLRRKSRLGRENSVQKQELNDLYGTYYRGGEYSVATDHNPIALVYYTLEQRVPNCATNFKDLHKRMIP